MQPKITASYFFDALVFALAKKTEFKPYVSVSHTDVLPLVLATSGIDIEHPPLPLHGRKGLYRLIHFAYRNQTQGYCGTKIPLCVRGENGQWSLTAEGVSRAMALIPKFYTAKVDPYLEALEQEIDGVLVREYASRLEQELDFSSRLESYSNDLDQEIERVCLLPAPVVTFTVIDMSQEIASFLDEKPKSKPGKNLTSKWIDSKGSLLYERLRSYLERKLPRSLIMGKVDDHIQTFLTNLVRRDALAKRIESNTPIHISQVCAWARRSAYSDFRDEGRDPVTRTLHGALTRPEWSSYDVNEWCSDVTPMTINQTDKLRGGSVFSFGSEESSVDPMDYLVSPDDTETVYEQEDSFQSTIGAIEKAISDHLRGRWKMDPHDPFLLPKLLLWAIEERVHHQFLIDRFVLNLSLTELGEKYSLPQSEVFGYVNRIRKACKKAADKGLIQADFLQ